MCYDYNYNEQKVSNWLILTIRTVALIPRKVNFIRLSHYGRCTAKIFASNFNASVDWIKINSGIAQESIGMGDDVAIVITRHSFQKSESSLTA